jgi:hypothetical protein
MKTAYLLNPADERLENPKKRRKARKSKKSGRKGGYYRSKAWMAKIRKMSKRGRKKKSHRKANRPGFYSTKTRRKGKGYKVAHKRTVYTYTKNRGRRRGKRKSNRRRNAGGGGGTGGLIQYTDTGILPFRIPLPGVLGKIANGTLNMFAVGGIAFGGYVLSGFVVDAVEGAMGETLAGKFRRPILFAAIAGVTAGVVSMVAPKGKKATWAIIAGSGAAIRALAGLYTALVAPPAAGDTGFAAVVYGSANHLADYLQVGDLYEAGMGNGEEITDTWGDQEGRMMDDYLQVGDLYEAGMGTRDVFAPA